MSPLQLVTALLLVSRIRSGIGQLPENGCSPLFEYQGYQGQYIGQVKVIHPFVKKQSLILKFSQQGSHDFEGSAGTIHLVDDRDKAESNLRKGLPIRYRVDFPIPTIPPKITSLQVNGIELCSGAEYPEPREGITGEYTWELRTSPVPVSPKPRINSDDGEVQPRNIMSAGEDDWTLINTASQLTIRNPDRAADPQPTIRNLVPQQTDPSEEYPCGRVRHEKTSTTPLIFQGNSIERGQLPWLVAIFERRDRNGPRFICGGSLISTSSVLSAAHCFRVPKKELTADRLAVSLGRTSLALHSPGEDREVSQLIIHENFKFEQFTEADLALIKLDAPVDYYDYIIPICLWSTSSRLDLPQGHNTYVAGWGPDESGTGHTDVAKVTDLNIVIESGCRLELAPELVQPSSLCAKRAGAGPCTSDGGGPLMLKEQDVFILRGVTSAGQIDEERRTCDLTKPSVFTDVAKHINWIRQNMWN
ncbi:mastin-like [Drosophila takahashii]|uniref:mastin-like n=1 Tax=Drosophila takahashii TaxID=29030 RepID=UPI001CF8A9CB|nr:mastin-like [Drosophila takahashii]